MDESFAAAAAAAAEAAEMSPPVPASESGPPGPATVGPAAPPQPPAAGRVEAPAQSNTDVRFSAEAMREALEAPPAHWARIGALPAVAGALVPFPSELQTRPKGRLDLVSWVATISGFGCDGPAEGDWEALFAALCFEPLRLTEVEIATLIAYQKCCDDVAPDITTTNLVKMRIRPAVEGRLQARAPGILLQVQRKYDEYLYNVWPLCLLNQAVRDTDPAALLDPVAATGGCDALGGPVGIERVRSLCEREVDQRVKLWERVMLGLLRLNRTQESPRVRRYHLKKEEYRSRLRDTLVSIVGLFLLNRQTQVPLQ